MVNRTVGLDGADPWQVLAQDLEAVQGDIEGALVWKNVLLTAFRGNLHAFLSKEESAFFGIATGRMMEVLSKCRRKPPRNCWLFIKREALIYLLLALVIKCHFSRKTAVKFQRRKEETQNHFMIAK